MEWSKLKTHAKELGINTHGMKRPEVEAAIDAKGRLLPEATPASNLPREPRSEDREPTAPRKNRRPLGGPSLKLDYHTREGYHRHWMNDHKNRLHDADQAGYEFVEENIAGRQTRVSRRVGVHEDGSPLLAYLMEIRQEFYDEDAVLKQAHVDEIDAAILRPDQPNDTDGPDGGFYTPSEGTSIRVAS